jgi:hypothetical protein
MMQSSIWQMVHTRISEDAILDIPKGTVGRGHGQVPRGGAPPPLPVSLEQLLAMQNDLMRRLVENDERHGAERQQPRHQERDLSYSDFLATHPLVYADATDPLVANSWLCTQSSSLDYFTVQSIKRLCTQRISLEVQLEHGGLPTSPPCLMITMFHGVNSVLPSVHTTYLQVCSAAS